MRSAHREAIERFAVAARRVAAYGLVRCSSGNLSRRLDGEHMLVTASRSWLADLTAEQTAICRLADAEPLDEVRPSIESRFHAGILRNRPDVDVVLHFQSPCATTLACCEPAAVNYDIIVEVPCYIGPVAVVPYLLPGSAELADAVVAAMTGHDVAQMRNHGQITVGTTYDDAIQRAAFFELACEVILRGGDRLHPLSARDVESLRRAMGHA